MPLPTADLPILALLLLLPFAIGAAHLIWNRERIFQPVQHLIRKWRIPVLGCPECNLFWIGLAFTFALPFGNNTIVQHLFVALAMYGIVRSAYAMRRTVLAFISEGEPAPPEEAVEPERKTCTSCGSGSAAGNRLEALHKAASVAPYRALILAHHDDWGSPDAKITLGMIDAFASDPNWFAHIVALQVKDVQAVVKNRNIQQWTNVRIDQFVDSDSSQRDLLTLGNGVVFPRGEVPGSLIKPLSNIKAFPVLTNWAVDIVPYADKLPEVLGTPDTYKRVINKEPLP